jgi:hypothetical protein
VRYDLTLFFRCVCVCRARDTDGGRPPEHAGEPPRRRVRAVQSGADLRPVGAGPRRPARHSLFRPAGYSTTTPESSPPHRLPDSFALVVRGGGAMMKRCASM